MILLDIEIEKIPPTDKVGGSLIMKFFTLGVHGDDSF